MNISHGKELSIILEQIALLQRSTVNSLTAIGQMEPQAAELHFYTAKKAAKDVLTMFDDLARQLDDSKTNRS
jgi:hypothetical protein